MAARQVEIQAVPPRRDDAAHAAAVDGCGVLIGCVLFGQQ